MTVQFDKFIYSILESLDAIETDESVRGKNDLENIQTGVPITITTYRATQTAPSQQFKISKEGDLGSGIYLTTSKKFAESYLTFDPSEGTNNRTNRRLATAIVTLNNPVVVTQYSTFPIIDILLQIGMNKEKAADRIEKDYERIGALGKWVQFALEKAGHDGMIVNRGDDIYEIVAYNPRNIREV